MRDKLKRILRDIYPGRDPSGLTSDEIELAERAIVAATRDAKRSRGVKLDPLLGSVFSFNGREYEVIARPVRLEVSEACSGCAFARRHCPAARCSSFDRSDGVNVWFIECSIDG